MLVIKKQVSLDFLGEPYKEAYLIFRAMPSSDFEEIVGNTQDLEGIASIKKILEILKKYFIKGEAPDEDGKLQPVEANDLGNLDPSSLSECFSLFAGVKLDPKEKTPSTTSLPTVESSPENS